MNIIIKPVILIVESDKNISTEMERALHSHAKNQSLDIKIIHTSSLDEAKRKMLTDKPDSISTAMRYPLQAEGTLDETAGAHLYYWVRTRSVSKILIYTESTIEQTKNILCNTGAVNASSGQFPPIFQKQFQTSHDTWAQAVLRQLFTK